MDQEDPSCPEPPSEGAGGCGAARSHVTSPPALGSLGLDLHLLCPCADSHWLPLSLRWPLTSASPQICSHEKQREPGWKGSQEWFEQPGSEGLRGSFSTIIPLGVTRNLFLFFFSNYARGDWTV